MGRNGNEEKTQYLIADLHDCMATLTAALAQLPLDTLGDTMQNRALHTQMAKAASAAQTMIEHVQEVAQDRDDWKTRSAVVEQQLGSVLEELRRSRRRARELHDDLIEVYRDLRAEDLPTLILKIAMRLTGAEQGLYFDADASKTLSAVGLDDMDDEPRKGLYDVARQSLQACDEIVINECERLPDGLGLVNVAAVPVAVRGAHHGILLVANKRSGPFTEEDTELLLSIGKHAGVALQNNRLHCDLTEAYLGTVAVLADAIEAKDPYTRGHCESVSALAVRVADRLGVDSDEQDTLRYAALLHDVGKIGVSDEILLKPGHLTEEEQSAIRRHSVIGRDLVSRVPALSSIAPLVLYHHERMDGKGYPQGLPGDKIPLGARIIAVVDALDAMTSTRPYRPARSQADALQELRRCSGAQFDPQIVATVEELLTGSREETTAHLPD